MLKRPASLKARLLLMVVGTSVCVWAVAAVLTWNDARHELDELLDGHLAQAAALLVARQAREFEDDERADAPSLHRYAPRVAFQVFHAGRLALRSATAPTQPMVSGAVAAGFHTVQQEGRAWRVFAARGAEEDVLVLVGEQVRSREAILWAVLRSMSWPMAVALPLLALGGWLAVQGGLRPLRGLGRALAARKGDDVRPLALPDVPSEMAPVVAALDTLFTRIAGLIDNERRFTGDAAHELRTPIAAIRMQAQVALGATDEASRRHALQATLAGCDRATRLVDQLLLLSRLEAQAGAARQPVDFAAVAQRVVAELAPAAIARHQHIALAAAPGSVAEGDEALLAALARNLVDNALRYSPAGARIDVRVVRAADSLLFSVDDDGPGLADADLARLGQRFFRAAGNEAPGSGLGWSIARRIAAAHGAQLHALRSARLGGLRVEARFPGAIDAAMRK